MLFDVKNTNIMIRHSYNVELRSTRSFSANCKSVPQPMKISSMNTKAERTHKYLIVDYEEPIGPNWNWWNNRIHVPAIRKPWYTEFGGRGSICNYRKNQRVSLNFTLSAIFVIIFEFWTQRARKKQKGGNGWLKCSRGIDWGD